MTMFLQRLARSGLEELTLPSEIPVIDDYIVAALRSGFPEVVARNLSGRQRSIWLESYVDDLVTRDAALFDSSKDPAKLRNHVNALAVPQRRSPNRYEPVLADLECR